MGILYITMANTSTVHESKVIIRKICNTLSSKWENRTSKIKMNNTNLLLFFSIKK